MLDEICITLRGAHADDVCNLWIDVADNTLSRKWLASLNYLLNNNLHLEKNYCWQGWTGTARDLTYLCVQINRSIHAINASSLDYHIDDWFSPANVVQPDLDVDHAHMNNLHRYFEELQGWSGSISNHYRQADPETRWHIRQLLSMRKDMQAPEWKRPSQLMCWLNAPRYLLDEEDLELFGIETINRSMGGVYVGVNKAVGKHHWEVFCDEGRDSRINELTTSALRPQTEAAGDFDIEWARDPGAYHWQQKKLQEFRSWLEANGFDPEDKTLTIGHPKVAQVDLQRSFGTTDYQAIWQTLGNYLDVYQIRTGSAQATYDYRWSDSNYQELQQGLLT